MAFLNLVRTRVARLLGSAQDVGITMEVPNSQLWAAYVDDTRLSFNGSRATIYLSPGKYNLTWGVKGQPGAEYKIEITTPEKSKWSPKTPHRINADGTGGGYKPFTVHPKDS